MKLFYCVSVVFIGYLFFSISCRTAKNELTVSHQNFEGEIEQQQNLIFTFDKDIYPDSLLQKWDSTAYIEFTPAVKGAFKWNSSNEIMFSPSKGFQPGTEYTATLTSLLLSHSKVAYSLPAEKTFHFHTAPLRITETHVSYARGKNASNVVVQLDVSFNYDVNLGKAASHLQLSSDGNNISMMTTNEGSGSTLSLQFAPVSNLDQETPLKIQMNKGIPVSNSSYVSANDTAVNTSIPSRFNLTITGVIASHDGNEGTITVNTSQPVQEDSLKNMIAIEPRIPFDVSLNDAGFTITSAKLSPDKTYQLTISSKLEGAFGGKMKTDYSTSVFFGRLKPSVSFVNQKGMYLSSNGYKNLALNIVNIPAVQVTVIKVYENNLEQFMRRDKDYSYGYDANNNEEEGDEENGGEYTYYQTENLGDTIYKNDFVTSKLPKENAASILHLDFSDKIRDYNGIYVITVASKDHYWIQDSKVLSVSDIGLIVKQEQDNMYVFANSIKDASNIKDVSVTFYSTNNQKLYTAVTDENGVAAFKGIASHAPGFKVGMVTAKKNDDFSFVWLDKSLIETSRFDVGGRMPNSTGLNAMIYAERNLYRPGEMMHVSTVVRDEKWNQPGEVPVKFKLVMPNGKEFSTMRKILNSEGSAETSFSIPSTALTGDYTLQVLTGNDVLLNTYDISVEEFVPDRIKVNFNIDKKEYRPADSVVAAIQADNLFGTPAANRKYECELNLSKSVFSSKKFPRYDFSVVNNFSFNSDLHVSKVNEKGSATEVFQLPKDIANTGVLQGNLAATVFDETGRPVHRYQDFTVYTQPLFIGISSQNEYVDTRKPTPIGLIAVDKNDNLQSATVQVQVIKKEWHTVIEEQGKSFRYVSRQDDKTISQQQLTISGAATTFYFTPQVSGDYEVRIFYGGSNSYVSAELYAWGYGDTQYTSFEVNNEGNIDITTDKEKYQQGETINTLFTTPFDGKMLVT
ncbi:MAG TPA: MG2 domain-containing protein, partial [Chitinophagaceae bacterium]|nr:MG2 domain-containing protein [Chitinophagaceae bacterium]